MIPAPDNNPASKVDDSKKISVELQKNAKLQEKQTKEIDKLSKIVEDFTARQDSLNAVERKIAADASKKLNALTAENRIAEKQRKQLEQILIAEYKKLDAESKKLAKNFEDTSKVDKKIESLLSDNNTSLTEMKQLIERQKQEQVSKQASADKKEEQSRIKELDGAFKRAQKEESANIKKAKFAVRSPALKALETASISKFGNKKLGDISPGGFLSAVLAGVESVSFAIQAAQKYVKPKNSAIIQPKTARPRVASPVSSIRNQSALSTAPLVNNSTNTTREKPSSGFLSAQKLITSGFSDIKKELAIFKPIVNQITSATQSVKTFMSDKISNIGDEIRSSIQKLGIRIISLLSKNKFTAAILVSVMYVINVSKKIFKFVARTAKFMYGFSKGVFKVTAGLTKMITGKFSDAFSAIKKLSPTNFLKDLLMAPGFWILIANVLGYAVQLKEEILNWVSEKIREITDKITSLEWWKGIATDIWQFIVGPFNDFMTKLWDGVFSALGLPSIDEISTSISKIVTSIIDLPAKVSDFIGDLFIDMTNTLIAGINKLLPSKFEIDLLRKTPKTANEAIEAIKANPTANIGELQSRLSNEDAKVFKQWREMNRDFLVEAYQNKEAEEARRSERQRKGGRGATRSNQTNKQPSTELMVSPVIPESINLENTGIGGKDYVPPAINNMIDTSHFDKGNEEIAAGLSRLETILTNGNLIAPSTTIINNNTQIEQDNYAIGTGKAFATP